MVSKEVESICCGKNGKPLELPRAVTLQLSRLGGLRKLLEQLPEESRIRRIAEGHQALSDPIRLRLMWALSLADLCPCVLKQISKLPDSKLSYHLRILEESGLVSSRRTRNWMIYSITPLGLKALKSWNDID